MFVILTYDVDKSRDAKLLKIGRRYLKHVQKSVLEGTLTDAQFRRMKGEIQKQIKPAEDSVNIYVIENLKYCYRERIGVLNDNDNIL